MQKSLDSDLILGKKTFPIILCNEVDKNFVSDLKNNGDNIKNILSHLRAFIEKHKIDLEIKNSINNFYEYAKSQIDNINFINDDLINFVNTLKKRNK